MKEIQLSQGKIALVDDEDYEYLNQWNWHAYKSRNTYYAIRNIFIGRKRTSQHMHRLLIDNSMVDHLDHNGLNNQKDNLRKCTRSQNGMNRRIMENTKSIYKGVSKQGKKWQASITTNRQQRYLGVYNTEIEAAIVYNINAKELFGEFAYLNTINNG